MPTSASATRWPRIALAVAAFWAWMLRTRTRRSVDGGDEHELVADRDPTGVRRAGDDGAGAGEREDAIDRQPKAGAVVDAGAGRSRGVDQQRAHAVDAGAAHGRRDDQRRSRERRSLGQLARRAADLVDALAADAIGLGDDDRTAPHAEQAEHGEVLARLRHHAVVGGDEQQREVDAGRAREHGAHQPLVAGHVDEADALARRRQSRNA